MNKLYIMPPHCYVCISRDFISKINHIIFHLPKWVDRRIAKIQLLVWYCYWSITSKQFPVKVTFWSSHLNITLYRCKCERKIRKSENFAAKIFLHSSLSLSWTMEVAKEKIWFVEAILMWTKERMIETDGQSGPKLGHLPEKCSEHWILNKDWCEASPTYHVNIVNQWPWGILKQKRFSLSN